MSPQVRQNNVTAHFRELPRQPAECDLAVAQAVKDQHRPAGGTSCGGLAHPYVDLRAVGHGIPPGGRDSLRPDQLLGGTDHVLVELAVAGIMLDQHARVPIRGTSPQRPGAQDQDASGDAAGPHCQILSRSQLKPL